MIKKYFTVLICILVICGISVFTSKSFSQEETPEPPPEELIKEMLADEELPEEIRRELEEILKTGQIGEAEEARDEVTPKEEVAKETEEAEEPEPKRPGNKPAKAKISSDESNKISLDLKGVDIIDVLKMLSARSNLNIVAGRNVRGRVTLFLKDVDVWDAFEIILAANDLAYEKEGDIINVMTERDYEQLYGERYYSKKALRIYKLEYAKAADVSKALNLAKSKIGKIIVDEGSNTIVLIDSYKALSEMGEMIAEMDMPIETRVFSLDYAKAEDVKEKLSDILTKGVGTVHEDERTNKLVITDLTKKMPEITNVITEMDEKHKVVLIEAKIVEIELQDEFEYGVDWQAIFRSLGDEGVRSAFDTSGLGNVFGGATGGALTITSLTSKYFSIAIEALKSLGKTNVISCPRITVLNNEEAKVLVGTQQPYVESTTTVTDTTPITSEVVKYIDVGIELNVTPTINKDGYVTMKIKPEISSLGEGISTAHAVGATGNLIYPISTSVTETTVMVKDGNTIVIAGLIQDRDVTDEDKVPLLGDIPLIGNLFKRKSAGSTTQPEKKELVIFLTPYIIGGSETFPEAENVWYGDTVTQRDLLEQQMSMAVEDLQRKRSLFIEPSPPKEKKDTTMRISKDLKWAKEEEGIEKLREEAARLRKEKEPVKRRGTIPEKVVTIEEWEEEELLEPEEEKLEREKAVVPTALIAPPISGYYSYFENVRNRIFWVAKNTYPMGFKGSEDVEILFTLTNEGRLKSEPEVLNGVDKELAKAAKSAVEKAAPFPPFPRKMDKDEESFKIIITYH